MKHPIKIMVCAFLVFFLVGCNEKIDQGHSIEQLVAKARLNFANYEISRVYDVCPSRTRRYLVAFKTTVRYDLDLENHPLKLKKDSASGKYTVYAPAIEMDENVGSRPYSRKAWKLNGSIFVNDAAEVERQKEHVEAYSLHLASKQLGSKELTDIFTEKLKLLVNAISLGTGTEIKQSDINVVFAEGQQTEYPMPELERCTQGEVTW